MATVRCGAPRVRASAWPASPPARWTAPADPISRARRAAQSPRSTPWSDPSAVARHDVDRPYCRESPALELPVDWSGRWQQDGCVLPTRRSARPKLRDGEDWHRAALAALLAKPPVLTRKRASDRSRDAPLAIAPVNRSWMAEVRSPRSLPASSCDHHCGKARYARYRHRRPCLLPSPRQHRSSGDRRSTWRPLR